MKPPKNSDGLLPVVYQLNSNDFSYLEGRLLTLIEASIGDTEQRKAVKDLVRQTVWSWAHELMKIGNVPSEEVWATIEMIRQEAMLMDSKMNLSPEWVLQRMQQIADLRTD